jgi:hypothetical protein
MATEAGSADELWSRLQGLTTTGRFFLRPAGGLVISVLWRKRLRRETDQSLVCAGFLAKAPLAAGDGYHLLTLRQAKRCAAMDRQSRMRASKSGRFASRLNLSGDPGLRRAQYSPFVVLVDHFVQQVSLAACADIVLGFLLLFSVAIGQ